MKTIMIVLIVKLMECLPSLFIINHEPTLRYAFVGAELQFDSIFALKDPTHKKFFNNR